MTGYLLGLLCGALTVAVPAAMLGLAHVARRTREAWDQYGPGGEEG